MSIFTNCLRNPGYSRFLHTFNTHKTTPEASRGGDVSLHTARFYELYSRSPEVDLSFKLWPSQ